MTTSARLSTVTLLYSVLMLTLVGSLNLTCSHNRTDSELTVTYVANCGFLLETGGRKVIIDGLLKGPADNYFYLPNDSVVDLMRLAEAPFDDIDLILVTHAHHDHFDAEVTASNMVNNPAALLVGPPQVREELQKTAAYARIKDRIHVIPARADSIIRLSLQGIAIEALPSAHSPYIDLDTLTGEDVDIHAGVDHLEYIVRVGDRVVYHSGDADLNDLRRYRAFGFGDTTIDLAMVDWWDEREMISFRSKLIHDVIRPERIVMMHMFPNRPPRGQPQTSTAVAPEVYLPDSMLQSWKFE